MNLEICSLNLAKKLKEVGFPHMVNMSGEYSMYCKKGHHKHLSAGEIYHNGINLNEMIPAPTLELAKMWFREAHNIHVIAEPYTAQYNTFKIYKLTEIINIMYLYGRNVNNEKSRSTHYDSYEQALEAGLMSACELIKTK